MNSTKIAVVTGGNRGLGLAVCRQLAEEGKRVYLTSRSEEEGQMAATQLVKEGLDVHFYHVDVTDDKSVKKFASFIKNIHKSLDILVNSDAIFYDLGHRMSAPDFEAIENSFNTNILGPWRMSAALLPALSESSHPRIVNVSSGAGSFSLMSSGTPAYSVSKAAINVLTIKMAAEWKKRGIKVNAVCPGWVRTEMSGQSVPRSVEQGAASIVWAANIPDDGPTGGFFRDGEPISW